MTTKNTKDHSTFAKAALALDSSFQEFERLAFEIDRVALDSDRGLERALALLAELGTCKERFGPASQELAKSLEEARERTAKAAELLAAREGAIQERHQKVEQLLARYRGLAEMVQQITVSVAKLKQSEARGLGADEQALLASHLPEISGKLALLADEARKLMDEARLANMKTLERNADSLRQSLQAARHRFGILAERQPDA